jgi:hypothetical protein
MTRHKKRRTEVSPRRSGSTDAGSPDAPERPERAVFTLGLLAAALLIPSLFYPFARDQGVFAYAGSLILKGGWPYRDVWDLKPPGIYYTYAAMLGCTGSTMAGVRACDLIAAVLTALLLRGALEPMIGSQAAWLGSLLSAALYLRLGFWGMAQAESFANFWIMAALWAWLRGAGLPAFGRSNNSERVASGTLPTAPSYFPIASVGAGVAAAAALLLKVTALPPLAAALAGVSGLRIRRGGWRPEALRIVLFLAGLLAPLVLSAGALTLSGAGAAYLDIQRGFVAGYVAMPEGARGAAASGWHYFWRLYSVPIVVAAAGLLAAPRPARLLLGLWLAAAVASVVMQRKYFGYHWTPVLLPLAALAGTGLARALELATRRLTTETLRHRGGKGRQGQDKPGLHGDLRRAAVDPPSIFSVSLCLRGESGSRALSRPRWWLVVIAGTVLIAGWSIERRASGYGETVQLLAGRLPLTTYWKRFGRPYRGDFSFMADAWAAAYIRRHTRPAEPVYIWGFEPLTLFLAGRRAPTRFVFAVPLVSRWTPRRWRAEFLREIRAHPPVLFGVMRHDAIPHASGRTDDSAAQLAQFPELRDFLRRGYRYETTIEDLTLYRRKGPNGGR